MKIRRNITALLVLMAMLAAVGLFVPITADAAYYPQQVWSRFSATCGETITQGQMVAIADADGYAYAADANVTTERPALGIAGTACVSGGSVEVVTQGIFTGWTTLAEGSPAYLSETAGAVTQSAPTWSQQVGYAISTTSYYINCINYFDTATLTVLGTLTGASPLVLEGATANDYETTIGLTDPTADRAITIPDAPGTVMLSSLSTNGADAANAVTGASNGLVFEGATADAYETTIAPTDPTADQTITLPNATGTVALRTGEATTTTDTLTAAECGKVIFLNSATEFATTLPAVSTVAAGCQFEFIVKAAAASADYTIVTGNSLENKIYGSMEVAGAVVACADEDTITLVDGNAVGDWVKVISDGTNWYISGSTVTTAKATCTAAD